MAKLIYCKKLFKNSDEKQVYFPEKKKPIERAYETPVANLEAAFLKKA